MTHPPLSSKRKTRQLWAVVLLLLALPLLASAGEPLPVEQVPMDSASETERLIKAIQRRYENVTTFKAQFTQTSYHPKLKTLIEEGGTVDFKKPGRMRWDYTLRKVYTVVGESNRVWILEPDRKKATVYPFESQTALTFLTGLGKLQQEFDAQIVPALPPEFQGEAATALELTPRVPNPFVRDIQLIVAPDGSEVVGTIVTDPYGKPTITRFAQREYNVPVEEESFKVAPPGDWETLDPQRIIGEATE